MDIQRKVLILEQRRAALLGHIVSATEIVGVVTPGIHAALKRTEDELAQLEQQVEQPPASRS